MSDIQVFQFNRIAERLVLSSIKKEIIEFTQFPSGHIQMQSPSDQYINTRNQTVDSLEQDRFPLMSIFVDDEDDITPMGMTFNHQQTSTTATGLVTCYEGRRKTQSIITIVVETLTNYDYMKWKDRMNLFFKQYKGGMKITNEILPNDEYFNFIRIGQKEFTDNSPKQTIYTVKCLYNVYQEYQAYLFKEIQISGSVTVGEEVDGISDSAFSFWTGSTYSE